MTRRIWLALAVVVLIAAFTRLAALETRPPHHDEGVNGYFSEKVTRDGYHVYDPSNYHGPAYFYVLAGSREAFGHGVWQLRLPAALIGIALCLTPLILRRRLGWQPTIAACALLAASPTLVYYARYAIHETFLAALGLLAAACILRWAEGGRLGWLFGAAAAIAGMVATKETTVMFVAAGGLWLVGETAVESCRARCLTVLGRRGSWSWRLPVIAIALLATMAAIHVLLFTGFFQAPGSITAQLDRSIDSYRLWTKTGTAHGGHEKDVCYYLHLGVRYELVLYVLAAVGAIAGIRDRVVRGPALVGLIMLGLYSAVPYKMPWLPLSWLALLAIPAGRGAIVLGRVLGDELSRRLGAVAATALVLVPALAITARSSFVRPADQREALAYVHTSADYNRWFPLVAAGARLVGRTHLTIGIDHDNTWPLVWSLSPYKQVRWAVRGDEDILVIAVSRSAAAEPRLAHAYLRATYQTRNGAEAAHVYLRRSLYARLLGARARSGEFVVVDRGGGVRPAARPAVALALR